VDFGVYYPLTSTPSILIALVGDIHPIVVPSQTICYFFSLISIPSHHLLILSVLVREMRCTIVSNFNFHYNGLFLFGALCVGVELKQAGFIFVLFLVFSS
jgi:hypothetical protein